MKNGRALEFNFSRLERSSFLITVQLRQNKDWEFWTLITSDRHWDNPKSDWDLQKKHLEQAKQRGAAIIDAGDFFCLMQGKWDKRSNKSAIRPEHNNDHYLDSVIDTAADFFEPYAHLFTVIATGNHEQAIANRYETNMIERFASVLNDRTGSHVCNGGFSGFVRFRFHTREGAKGSRFIRKTLHFDHGYGGGGPVTADMIQSSRRAMYLPDADFIIHGHTHDQWHRTYARKRLGENGKIYHDTQEHIKVGTYKDGYADGFSSWEATKGMPPKPLGAWWIRFYYDRKSETILHEVIRAQ